MTQSKQSAKALDQAFLELYGGSLASVRRFFAPGRVNLIGEHTDYNGGLVFPAPLILGTTMLIRPRTDGLVSFASLDFPERKQLSLAEAVYDDEDGWVNYPKSILVHLQKRGYTFRGYDVLYSGSIPNQAGLSSSSSIHLVTAFGFMSMEKHPIDRVELAITAREAENQFMNVQCGIMDQFIIAMGKKEHALKLMCSNLEYEHVPFPMDQCALMISNTGKTRGLVDSAYNERREQCSQAVQQLRQQYPALTSLGELTPKQLAEAEFLISSEVIKKRAQHVVHENHRVKLAVQALAARDYPLFGEHMNASHESLRDLYEVSCKELDVMVEESRRVAGVLGSRMTGAGFGGCTVTLIERSAVDSYAGQVAEAYKARTGLQPAFYVADIGEGVHEIEHVD